MKGSWWLFIALCCTVLRIKLKNIFIIEMYNLYLLSPIKPSPAEVLTVVWLGFGTIILLYALNAPLSGLKLRIPYK